MLCDSTVIRFILIVYRLCPLCDIIYINDYHWLNDFEVVSEIYKEAVFYQGTKKDRSIKSKLNCVNYVSSTVVFILKWFYEGVNLDKTCIFQSSCQRIC